MSASHEAQQDALAGALDQVGWVQQVLVSRRSGFVVDGHARVALALSRGEATVPVLYVDLETEEEALVLATLDPIGAMAGATRASSGPSFPRSRWTMPGSSPSSARPGWQRSEGRPDRSGRRARDA